VGRFASALFLAAAGCTAAPSRPPATAPERDSSRAPIEAAAAGLSLASFADELALSIEPSKLEDETTASDLFVFNRGSRTWVIALESTEDGERSVQLDVRDATLPDRPLPPAPIGITQQCPRPPLRDVRVIGPGERGFIACVEKLVDVRGVDEIELEADLHFVATDGSRVRVHSPAFRVARRPKPATPASPAARR